jgi:hypothetical protein
MLFNPLRNTDGNSRTAADATAADAEAAAFRGDLITAPGTDMVEKMMIGLKGKAYFFVPPSFNDDGMHLHATTK